MKKVFYWLSIVLPLIDAILGVRDGLKKAKQDFVKDTESSLDIIAEQKERDLWDRVNRDSVPIQRRRNDIGETTK